MRLFGITLLTLMLTVASCGPALIGLGVEDVTESRQTTQVLLVFVNENGEPIVLDLRGGGFSLANLRVEPGATARVAVPAQVALSVRGQDIPDDSRPPVAWNYTIAPDGAQVTSTLAKETMIFASWRSGR